jgi:hypothetical protein
MGAKLGIFVKSSATAGSAKGVKKSINSTNILERKGKRTERKESNYAGADN